MRKVLLWLWLATLAACHRSEHLVYTTEEMQAWMMKVQQEAKQNSSEPSTGVGLFGATLPSNADEVFTSERVSPKAAVSTEHIPSQPKQTADAPLPQTGPVELKYLGLMSQNGQSVGMVQVGQRVYPVRVGDAIEAGQWPVLSLDAQSMRLKVAQKAVVYEKN
ncbi:MAG: hypothetical protein ACRCV6_06195 [Formosimonas sp.]